MAERNQNPSKTLKFQSRQGTEDQGQIYEKNMLVLYALKFCLDAKVREVLMVSNVNGFGDLDDVILRVEYDQTKDPELYVIQLKHKEKEDYCIMSNELTKSNKGNFSFEKYKKSYETIISKLGDQNDPLMERISKENICARLVTNAKLKTHFDSVLFESANVTRKSTLSSDLIDTKPGYFNTFHIANPTTPVQHEYSTFFDNYRFYDGQVNYKESKEEIMSLLKIKFETENDEITEKLIKFVHTQIKEKKNVLNKKIVKTKLLELLTGITDQTQLDRKYETFENITSINDHDQRITISKEIFISLQGRAPLSLYELTNETFHKTVPGLFLFKNIKETVNVGKRDFEKPKNYIKRRFFGTPLLKKKVLSETNKNIFLFTSPLPPNIIGKIKILTELETTNLHSSQFTDSNLAVRVSENELKKTINRIQEHKDLKSFAVHQVEEHNKRRLKLQRSWSDSKNLRKYIKRRGGQVDEHAALQYFKSGINIVSAIPGMGKSTILHTLADYCNPNVLALRLDLKKHEADFKNENSELRLDPLKFILQKILSEQNKEFEEQLFIHLVEKKRLILFVDAFDEISPTHSDAVLSIIKKVKDNQIPIWIFTRPVAQSFLQKRFDDIIPIDMVPLENDEIIDYLVRTVGRAEINNLKNSLSSRICDLCNAPLYLYMLSTLITERGLNIRDLKMTDLYDNFIEMSYQKHMEKRNIATNSTIDMLESYKSTYLEVHKTAALVVTFGKDYLIEKQILKQNDLESIKHFKTCRKNYELIVSVNDETPEFSHRTFAEYFAALHIYENLLNKKEFRELSKLLFEDKYEVIKLMFDRIAAKEFPFHLAVVEEDMDKVEALSQDPDSSKMFKTDKFGRTVLHLFSLDEGILQFLNSLMIHFKNRQDILQQRDHILNLNFYQQWTKFHLNYLRQSIYIPEFSNSLENSEIVNWNEVEMVNLLHIAVELKLTNILECVPHVDEMRKDINNKTTSGYTPIHIAAKTGFVNVIKLLKDNGANINAINRNGMSALFLALKYTKEECVELLIREGADINWANCLDSYLLIHYAVRIRNINIFKLLLQVGVFDKIDEDGTNALHFVSVYGSEKHVNCFIEHGIQINKKDHNGRTAMHYSAETGNVNIIKLLNEKGGRTDEIDSDGLTVLHYASKCGFIYCVKYLTSQEVKVDVNKKAKDGKTPLHVSARKGHVDILKHLIDNGGNIYEIDTMGKTPLHYASERDHTKCVQYLLNEIPELDKLTLYINQKDQDGRTSLHFTAARGNFDILKLLIDKGGSIYETDSVGYTPLHYTSQGGQTKCAEYLLRKIRGLEELKLYVNQKTKHGMTSMHLAASKGCFNVVKLLKDGRIDDVDQLGATALHLALSRRPLDYMHFIDIVDWYDGSSSKPKDYKNV